MHYLTLVETVNPPASESEVLSALLPFEGKLYDYALVGGGWGSGESLADNTCRGSDLPKTVVPYYFLTAEGEMMVNGIDWRRDDSPEFDDYERAADWLEACKAFEREGRAEFRSRFRLKPDRYYTVVDCHN